MQRIQRLALIAGMALALVGCKGGGGAFGLIGDSSALGSFFGGDGSSSGSGLGTGLEQLVALDPGAGGGDEGDGSPDGESGGPSGESGDTGGDSGGPDDSGDPGFNLVGTVHEPEPASVALFAGGLSLALLRRRTRKSV